jgi:transposase
MIGPQKQRHFDRQLLVSLENLVPRDNFYRHLDAKLDLSFVREWAADCYAERGRPSIDPVVFFKLQLILFFEGLRSERKLIETASLHLAHRWYVGYDLDEALPDHSSLTRIRARLGVDLFQRFFERIVEMCQEAGLVWGKELFFDGTKIRANADIDSLTPRFAQRAREHVRELFVAESLHADGPTSDTALPDEAGPSSEDGTVALPPAETNAVLPSGAPLPLPFAGTPTAEQQLADENRAHWKLLDARRLDPNRPPSGPYRRITDFRVSTTDPDAAPMSKGDQAKLGYHDHYAVDGGKARIIVGVLVTPADVQDNQAMLDLLDRVRFRYHLPVCRTIADSKYATGENLRAIAERDIRAYMPVVDYDKTSPFFRQQDFTYDAETDTYRCPQGETLRFRGNNYGAGVRVYAAPAAACSACPLRARCTDSKNGRKLNRSFDEDYRELARLQQTTEAYKKALRKRQVWVEPLFGEAKEWHNLRRFRLRGLVNVNIEGLLVAAGQNLKRWLQAVGRTHRPTASGSPHGILAASWASPSSAS